MEWVLGTPRAFPLCRKLPEVGLTEEPPPPPAWALPSFLLVPCWPFSYYWFSLLSLARYCQEPLTVAPRWRSPTSSLRCREGGKAPPYLQQADGGQQGPGP